jgi:hypothetical protein
MRWQFFAIIGIILLALGVFFVTYMTTLPVYYAGGGTGISKTGKLHVGLAPESCEVSIITLPTTIHINMTSIEPLNVTIIAPNGTTVAKWQNETIQESLPATECGFWHVIAIQPSNYFIYGEVYATTPQYAHPALLYSFIPFTLGAMSLLYSFNKRKHASYFQNILFEQNIGGRWVFLAWIPILGIISQAPLLIPSISWLYALLIIITVIAVFSSIALAYVKIYLTPQSLNIEAPFLNFHKHYEPTQIYGYTITQEEKQRLLGFYKIPSIHPKKEDQITISLLKPLPSWIWILSFGTRLYPNKIILRPKSTQKFTTAAEKLNMTKRGPSEI